MVSACSLLLSAFVTALYVGLATSLAVNPTILQDSRDLPQVDGTFGFLYRTEDGISHASKGDSNGVIHGTFSYTDPTGLKVNYNYNAGSRTAPGYNYNDQAPVPQKYNSPLPPPPPPPAPARYRQPEPIYEPVDNRQPPVQYREPPQQYSPRSRPPPRPQYSDPATVYQQRRSRPVPRENDINDDYNYRN